MEDITYFSVNEFSKGVLEFAEKAEFAKVLQANIATVDENSVRDLEKEIAERKWAISEFLHDGNNYEQWKNFTNNNAEMLTKYVEKNYFDVEFSGTNLKQKIERDFSSSLESNPELAITKREKLTLKHYEDNNVPESQRTHLKEFDVVVANIHNQEKCFARSFSKMLYDLPKKLTKEADQAVGLVKNNPLLLKDNPHHFVVNRGIEKPAVTTEQLKDILDDANLGDPSANSKLSKLVSSMLDMNKGLSNSSLVEQYRKQFLGTNITPGVKNDI